MDLSACRGSSDLCGKHFRVIRTQAAPPDDEHRCAAYVTQPVRPALAAAHSVLINDDDVHRGPDYYQRTVPAQ